MRTFRKPLISLRLTFSPIQGEHYEEMGVLILGQDITEHKRRQNELAQTQKLKVIGQLAAGIARAMKEFSHPDEGERVAIDLNKAIESTVTVARNEWKYTAEMILDLDPTLPEVPCFPGEINQAFLNLLINAAHAITEVVRAGGREKGTITVSTRRGVGAWVKVSIAGVLLNQE
jgi:nitrogen-specific signal transduction histidine kinase